jgi:hypothetical protein
MQSPDLSTLILLEAKGGQPGRGTWVDPKELRYYEFLKECEGATYKGFVYIVPAIAREDCMKCVRRYFMNVSSIRTGVIVWEDLLPVIHEQLMGAAVDYLLKNVEGVKHLRAWQRATPKATWPIGRRSLSQLS